MVSLTAAKVVAQTRTGRELHVSERRQDMKRDQEVDAKLLVADTGLNVTPEAIGAWVSVDPSWAKVYEEERK